MSPGQNPKPSYYLRTVGDALSILSLLSRAGAPQGITELSQASDLRPSKVHRILGTLRFEGWVEQDPATRKYSLGVSVLEMADDKLRTTHLVRTAEPHLLRLVEVCGETAHLAVLSNGRVLYLDKKESSQALGIISRVGQTLPVHCTALGKVLLADLGEEARQLIVAGQGLNAYTQRTVTDYRSLAAELETVRERGFAQDREELVEGLCCLAAPVRDHSGRVAAALSVSVPVFRMGQDKEALVQKETLEAANLLSRKLGYRPFSDDFRETE
jgi:DNA-binding IclR family transcriptional regulator